MNYCCTGLEHLIASVGQRGLSAIVLRQADGLRVRLQSRGVDWADQRRLGKTAADVNLVCTTGMRHCPFCGTELALLLDRDRTGWERLSAEHAKYSAPP